MKTRAACWLAFFFFSTAVISAAETAAMAEFPKPLESYAESSESSLVETLVGRARAEPFNVIATAIFFLAIVHTFLTSKFRHWAHAVEDEHARLLAQRRPSRDSDGDGAVDEVSFKGQILHFLRRGGGGFWHLGDRANGRAGIFERLGHGGRLRGPSS